MGSSFSRSAEAWARFGGEATFDEAHGREAYWQSQKLGQAQLRSVELEPIKFREVVQFWGSLEDLTRSRL